MTIAIDEDSIKINEETGEENPNLVYDEEPPTGSEGQVGEFEIEIGTQKGEDDKISIPSNEEELIAIIKANVEHNCNKMLEFCGKLLGKDYNERMTVIMKEKKDLEEEVTQLKTQIDTFKTGYCPSHFDITE